MRMRRKAHLDERLAACENLMRISGPLDPRLAEDYYSPLDFGEIFHNDNPVFLEIGCGKGRFAVEFAKRNPRINLLAVEKAGNVLVSACEAAAGIENLYFLGCGAEYLLGLIKEKSVGRIFLNFSCPFPKSRHESHRLTHPRFLNIYKKILQDGAEIHQKTDNAAFFEYSIEKLTGEGFALKNISLDLHNSEFEGNIETEYERRFSDLGKPIYRLEAYIK